MNWRLKLADWISGGQLTQWHEAAKFWNLKCEQDYYVAARMSDALWSIARNTCCEGCQEARLVAEQALEKCRAKA